LTGDPCPECPHGQKVRMQRELRQVRAMLDASGMSERVREWTLASYPAQDNPKFAKVVDFLAQWDEHQSLMLTGPFGTGKTGLLAGLTREVATLYVAGGRPDRRITWTTSVALMDALRAGYEDGTGAEKLERAKACSLLIIDDLGADKPKEWVLERLFTIINERYEGKRPTFISTNYGIEELAERIGPRVLERLTETARIIEVTGANLRRRGNGSAS
ncbi:MAG: ATP-binding protein, partial [Ktedonobacterales bacterium]